jgi:hypothetical protein
MLFATLEFMNNSNCEFKSSVSEHILHQAKIKVLWPMQGNLEQGLGDYAQRHLWVPFLRTLQTSMNQPISHQLKLDIESLNGN